MKAGLLVLPVALCALLLSAASPAAATLSPADYRERLAALDARLRSGDWVGARAEAARLSADRIAFGTERLVPDLSILKPLAAARDAKAALALAPRVARLARLIPPGAAASARNAAADPRLLADVRSREALAALPQGGAMPRGGTDLLAVLGEVLAPVHRFVSDAWERLLEWLERLFQGPRKKKPGPVDLPVVVTVLVMALAAAAAWLAARAWKGRRRSAPEAAPVGTPAAPAADADPLSRGADVWERYARELAAAGRLREAIRAWYHAVLVALFRAGVLHYRKGRTNWEYVSTLAPGYSWRGLFLEMTRSFEREWYGREHSSEDALRAVEELARAILVALREAA